MNKIRTFICMAAVASLCLNGARSSQAQVTRVGPPPRAFPADSVLRAAITLHDVELRAIDSTVAAGVWGIADSSGVIKESGVLSPFPKRVSSDDIQSTVPALRGRPVRAFFMSRPVVWAQARFAQVLWVTLMN